jgi:hypothetical protein
MTPLSWGALIPLLLLGHSHLRANSLGGLYEKIFLAAELLWPLLVAVPIPPSPPTAQAHLLNAV